MRRRLLEVREHRVETLRASILDAVARLRDGKGRTIVTFVLVPAGNSGMRSGLRERLELSSVPDVSKGAALTLMLAGMLSLAFMGFAGLGGQHA